MFFVVEGGAKGCLAHVFCDGGGGAKGWLAHVFCGGEGGGKGLAGACTFVIRIRAGMTGDVVARGKKTSGFGTHCVVITG